MYQLLAYINYWLHSVNEHSLHSPFLFEFYTTLIRSKEKLEIEGIEGIEQLRNSLLKNDTFIDIEDLGAGSRIQKTNRRKISQITKHASTPSKFSQLLFRLIQKYEPNVIVELGTSLGLNTLYMSQARTDSKIYTFEGSDKIASLAQENFSLLKATNIDILIGNIDATLPSFLSSQQIIDLAYLDANHRYAPTMNYFNQISDHLNKNSIVIIDDIHWSKDMKRAWNEIKKNPKVSVSLDLFEAGILFFDSELPKTDFILKY